MLVLLLLKKRHFMFINFFGPGGGVDFAGMSKNAGYRNPLAAPDFGVTFGKHRWFPFLLGLSLGALKQDRICLPRLF